MLAEATLFTNMYEMPTASHPFIDFHWYFLVQLSLEFSGTIFTGIFGCKAGHQSSVHCATCTGHCITALTFIALALPDKTWIALPDAI